MASASAKKIRSKYLSLTALLFEIRLPVPGWVSILHRLSVPLLVVPFAAWALAILDVSLLIVHGFAAASGYFQRPLVKLGMLLFVCAYCHHFSAGVRYLLPHLDIGIELKAARATSWAVIAI